LHYDNYTLALTKFTTYSASVVKSNFGNFGGINPFTAPWHAARACHPRVFWLWPYERE